MSVSRSSCRMIASTSGKPLAVPRATNAWSTLMVSRHTSLPKSSRPNVCPKYVSESPSGSSCHSIKSEISSQSLMSGGVSIPTLSVSVNVLQKHGITETALHMQKTGICLEAGIGGYFQ